MRIPTIVAISAVLLGAAPAFAQSQPQNSTGSGLQNIIRNLNDAVNGQGTTAPSYSPNRRAYNEPQYSGSSNPNAYAGPNGQMTFRSQADVQNEQQRLNNIQAQLNQAQQQLNQEWQQFNQARNQFQSQGR